MSEEAAADIGFRMSKKIAQLTKVIYQLNCRNEDSDAYARSIADRYENEISDIMGDAKAKITMLRDTLNAKKDEEKIQAVIREMTKTHQREKDEALKLFDEFKEKALRNEAAARQNFDERLASATRELASCKEEFAKTVKEIRDQALSSTAAGKSDFDAFRSRKEKEVDDLVREYNERYKAMLAEQMDIQDKLEKRLNLEWSKKLEELQSQLSGKAGDLSRFLADEKAKCKKLESDVERLTADLAKEKSASDSMSTEVFRLKQRCEHLATSLETSSSDLQKSEATAKSQRQQISLLEEAAAAAVKKASADALTIADLEGKLLKTTSDRTSLENDNAALQQLVSSLQHQLSIYVDEKNKLGTDLASQVGQLTDKLRASEQRCAEEEKKNKQLTLSLQSLEKSLQSLEEKLALQKGSYEKELESLKKMYDEKIAQMNSSAQSSAGDLLTKHKQEIEAMRSAMERANAEALSSLQKRHDAAVKELNGSFEVQLKAVNADSKKKIEELETSHKSAVTGLTKDYEGKVAALQAKIDEMLTRTSGDSNQMQKEIAALKASMDALKKEHAALMASQEQKHTAELSAAMKTSADKLQAAAEAHKAEIKVLETQVADLQKKLVKDGDQFKAELAAAKQQAADEMERIKAAHAAALRDATSSKDRDGAVRMQQELDKLRKELTDSFSVEKAAIVSKHETLMALEKKNADTTISRLEGEISALQAQLDQLQAKSSDATSTMAASIDKLKLEVASGKEALVAATTAHAAEIARLKDEHAAQIAELKRQMAARETDLSGEGQRALSGLRADYEAKMLKLGDDARAAQKDMEENYKNRIASLEKRKDEEIAKTIKELQDKKAEELKAAQASFDKDLEAVRKSRDMLEKELKAVCAQFKDAEGKIHALQAKIAEDTAAHEAELRNKDAAMTSQSEAFEAEKVQMREASASELQKLKDKSDEERRAFQAKIKQLQKHIAELEYKYANRESRQEDVEKINQLLRENKEKEEALLKAFNDMKFYKLELVNREESYNKVFGRQPSIANAGAAQQPTGPGAAVAADAAAKMNLPSTTAPSKMETAQIPPNMKRKSVAAEK